MQWNNTDVNNYATSTIHKYLNQTYYNTLPQQDREKLGAKAVQEEFHGELINGAWVYKRFYNWKQINTNIWIPSLSELVGYDPNSYSDWNGVYNCAMQGLGISDYPYVDSRGGSQFVWFKQHNASGGGEKIWSASKQEITWLRSSNCGSDALAWLVSGLNSFNSYDALPLTASYAVHPAVLYNPERPVKQTGLIYLYRQIICLYLMEQRQSWKYAVEQYGRQ